MRIEITEFINNFETCSLEKYGRSPVKRFKIIETPRVPNEIVHLDVLYSVSRSLFATMIDKFSKATMFIKFNATNEQEEE